MPDIWIDRFKLATLPTVCTSGMADCVEVVAGVQDETPTQTPGALSALFSATPPLDTTPAYNRFRLRRAEQCVELLCLRRLHERAPSVNGDDQSSLAEDLHGVPDGRVGDAVLLGEAAFAREFRGDLSLRDATCDVVGYLDIRILRPIRINRTRWHRITIECSLSWVNVS